MSPTDPSKPTSKNSSTTSKSQSKLPISSTSLNKPRNCSSSFSSFSPSSKPHPKQNHPQDDESYSDSEPDSESFNILTTRLSKLELKFSCQLTNSNYLIWSKKIKAYFITTDLWDVVSTGRSKTRHLTEQKNT
jgi:hypothetical protein